MAPKLDDELDETSGEFEKVSSRFNRLLAATEDLEQNSSPVLDACRLSLRTRVTLLLQQATLLVERMKNDDDESSQMIGKLRCGFAIFRLSQFLDIIENGMAAREKLDPQLRKVLDSVKDREFLGEPGGERRCFRLSAWTTKSLCFDILYGKKAEHSVAAGSGSSLPLIVEVEPIVELTADDLEGSDKLLSSFRPCQAVIEQCKHEELQFSAGSGLVGTAHIRIRLIPLDGHDHGFRVWGSEREVTRKIRINDARVVQPNSYPPKPKSSIDVYASCVYGDAAHSVTLIVKTCMTEKGVHAEPPRLHIEVSLGQPVSPSTT